MMLLLLKYSRSYLLFVIQNVNEGIVKKFCPKHLVGTESKANITCAVYNFDGTGTRFVFIIVVKWFTIGIVSYHILNHDFQN